MEEQKIITIAKPRVTIRKNMSGYTWDVGLSESGSEEELKKIVNEIMATHKLIKEKVEF